jgi:hypothetical protein
LAAGAWRLAGWLAGWLAEATTRRAAEEEARAEARRGFDQDMSVVAEQVRQVVAAAPPPIIIGSPCLGGQSHAHSEPLDASTRPCGAAVHERAPAAAAAAAALPRAVVPSARIHTAWAGCRQYTRKQAEAEAAAKGAAAQAEEAKRMLQLNAEKLG